MNEIDTLRLDFITRRKGNWGVPAAGMIVYLLAAALSLVVEPRWHNLVLTTCFFGVMPLGAMMMKLRGEDRGSVQENPLFDLAAKARWMALSTWALHIMVWIYAPDLFPVSLGICFALHWVIFSWMVGHPVGYYHLAMRIIFVVAAWHLVPSNRMGAVAAGIALAYAISVFMLSRIDWPAHFAKKVVQ